MISIVILFQLTFTIPDTLVDGRPFTDYSNVILYKQHQSPTWVAMHPAMLIDDAVWIYFWPIVKREAELVRVGDYVTSPITLPDTDSLYFYFLYVKRSNGVISGRSNQANWGEL